MGRKEIILEGLRVYLEPGQVTELRAFNGRGPAVCSVLYRDLDAMAEAAAQLDCSGCVNGIYFVPNPIRVELLPEGKASRKGSANAEAIARRRWLLIDADPVRLDANGAPLAGEHSATEAERGKAWEVIGRVQSLMSCAAFTGLVLGFSGNGFHADYPIDLPNDQTSYDMVASLLAGLEKRCGDSLAHIDQVTKDAPRVWKMYGTLARKGPNTDERPHRVTQLLSGGPPTEEVRQANNLALERLLANWRGLEQDVFSEDPRPSDTRDERLLAATAYLATTNDAIQGEYGSNACMWAARCVAYGFDIPADAAFGLLETYYNPRSRPPWSEKELRHKIADADTKPFSRPRGWLWEEHIHRRAGGESRPGAARARYRPGFAPVDFDSLEGEPTPAPQKPNKERRADDIAGIADLVAAGASVQWLWPGWIPMGVLTAIAAEGGVGKTRFVADLLRRIRHGLLWPDGSSVLVSRDALALWVVSDNNHDEMVKLSNDFGVVEGIRINAWKEDPYGGVFLDDPEDYRALDRRVGLLKPALVVIDTVGNSTDKSLSRQEDAKAYYEPLQRIARRHRTAVLCLTHLNAFGKFLGRRVLEKVRVAVKMAGPWPDDKQKRRRLEVNKTNSKRPGALGLTMGDHGNEYDNDPPKGDEEGAAPVRPRGRPSQGVTDKVANWLRGYLEGGKRGVGNTISDAEAEGFARTTLYDAKRQLELVEYTTQGRKYWELPASDADGPLEVG